MPGKFSRAPTVPNKPPVCHKRPITALLPGLPIWKRPANLFVKWEGDASVAFQQRSWAQELVAAGVTPVHTAFDDRYPIGFRYRINHHIDAALFDYQLQVFYGVVLYLNQIQVNLPYQQADPWDTGLISVPPNFATRSAEFEAMA